MRLALALALAGSLAANALLLLRRPAPAAPPTPAPVERPPPCACPPAPSLSPFGALPRPAREPAREPAAAPRAAVDDALEQDVLCAVAEEKLREGWRRDRDAITAGLRRSLADRDEQERNLRDNAAELADALALDGARRAELTARYRERRFARIAEARAALDRDPPDHAGLLAAAEGLFSDEDALATELGGPDGRERVRAAALEARTTLLAVAAALADVPFERVRW